MTHLEAVDNPQLTATWYGMPHVSGVASLAFLHIFPFLALYLHVDTLQDQVM